MEKSYVKQFSVDEALYRLAADRSADQVIIEISVSLDGSAPIEAIGRLAAPAAHLGPLREALDQVFNHFGAKAYSLQAIREHHPHAYDRWTDDQEQELVRRFEQGATVKEIADAFGRQEGAIRSRLARLGKLPSQPSAVEPLNGQEGGLDPAQSTSGDVPLPKGPEGRGSGRGRTSRWRLGWPGRRRP